MAGEVAFSAGAALWQRGIAVRQLARRGRGLVAAKRFRSGDLLFAESPVAWWQDPRSHAWACHHCMAASPRVPSAVASDAAQYCSELCRDADAKGPRQVTGISARAAVDEVCEAHGTRYPHVAFEMAVHALLLGTEGFDTYWKQVSELHYAQHPERGLFVTDAHRAEHDAIRRACAPALSGDVDPLFAGVYSIEWYTRLLGTLCINAFHIPARPLGDPASATSSPSPHGAGPSGGGADGTGGDGDGAHAAAMPPTHALLFHAASLLNHSAAPNVAISFPLCRDKLPLRREAGEWPDGVLGADRVAMGACAGFLATRDIAEGEELCISYVDEALPADERQRRLFKTWGFIEDEGDGPAGREGAA